MSAPAELFKVQVITDNPLFEGFGIEKGPSLLGRKDLDQDMTPGYGASKSRDWTPALLSKTWKPPIVKGRVSSFNDFPGISMTLPAFSRRACDALRPFLEPNGELLPLNSAVGEYYFYNITRIVDALDVQDSICDFWCDPPTTATDISYFAFHRERLAGLSIFRIIEKPIFTIVTDEFVKEVRRNRLNGFEFTKIWPLPHGVNWRLYHKEQKREAETQKKNTVVVTLVMAGTAPAADEKELLENIEDQVDGQLAVSAVDAPYFGSYEGHDIVEREYRMFLSCPDADALVKKLLPWLKELRWPGKIHVLKRYGEMYNDKAKEKRVEL
jgi:hypothetical protein